MALCYLGVGVHEELFGVTDCWRRNKVASFGVIEMAVSWVCCGIIFVCLAHAGLCLM